MWQVGQTQVLSESRQRNVQLASVISRDVNAKIGDIVSEIRVFSRHLELLSPDLDSQASAILAQRLASPNRLRAVYYFDNSGRLLLARQRSPGKSPVVEKCRRNCLSSPNPAW